MIITHITPLIITKNEIDNLERTLNSLQWAQVIIVIDSGSTDGTLQLLQSIPRVKVFYRSFDSFAGQCNFGLQQVVTPWVLSLDADYRLSGTLVDELETLEPCSEVCGYRARFVYSVFGQKLRGSLYPPRTVLYRKDKAVYLDEGHGHRVQVHGPIKSLKGEIFHDDRKPLSQWFNAQLRYAKIEAEFLLMSDKKRLNRMDSVRLMIWPAPIIVFFYTLFVKRCILDGWHGWFYAIQRVVAECMIALEILDRRLREQRNS